MLEVLHSLARWLRCAIGRSVDIESRMNCKMRLSFVLSLGKGSCDVALESKRCYAGTQHLSSGSFVLFQFFSSDSASFLAG